MGRNIDGREFLEQSGYSVALSDDGNALVVGAIGSSGLGRESTGKTRIFGFNNNFGWLQIGDDIDGEAGNDESGYSVSVSSNGKVVAIGAPRNDNDGGVDAGHARVYVWEGDEWIQRGIDLDGEAADSQLGAVVSLSGEGARLAIRSPTSVR